MIINAAKKEYLPKEHETIKKSIQPRVENYIFILFLAQRFVLNLFKINFIEEMSINFSKLNQERKCKCSSHLIYIRTAVRI